MRIFLSAITCKRPEGLRTLLNQLAQQKVASNITVNICIIDNDGLGVNEGIVSEYTASPFSVRCIQQPEKGIVHARNKAVEIFLKEDHDALVFIDDDEWPAAADWLQSLINAHTATGADIVTSHVITQPENEATSWTVNAFRRPRKCSNRHLQPTHRFYTNNLFITRKVLETITPAFDLRFLHTGSSNLFFCLRANKAGFLAVYTEDAPVIELFPASKANYKWFFLRGYRSGSGATQSEIFLNPSATTYLKCAAYAGSRTFDGLSHLALGLTPPKRCSIAHGIFRLGSGLGTLIGMVGLNYNEYKTTHGK